MQRLRRFVSILMVGIFSFLLLGCLTTKKPTVKRQISIEGTVYDSNAYREDMLRALGEFRINYVNDWGQNTGYCKLILQTMSEKQKQVAYRSFLEKGDFEFGLQLLKDVMPDSIEIDYSTYKGDSFVIREGYIVDQEKIERLFSGEVTWLLRKEN